jgi:hypothetical protein
MPPAGYLILRFAADAIIASHFRHFISPIIFMSRRRRYACRRHCLFAITLSADALPLRVMTPGRRR